jgi:hypothetical protein
MDCLLRRERETAVSNNGYIKEYERREKVNPGRDDPKIRPLTVDAFVAEQGE